MSWFRSAVNKAVEVGNNNNIKRNLKNYANTVVHQAGQAVSEGARIIQDRIGAQNFRSLKQTVKRLEEASVSCHGPERIQLMRRWLAAIKEIEKLTSVDDKEKNAEPQNTSEEQRESSGKQSQALYYDSDMGIGPMNFWEVFLYSQALEGITISMILAAPNEEEVSVLLEFFGLCLAGGKEVHNAIVSSVQDLAKAFSRYEDEVLVKREELLQFAESAITGLKVSSSLGRIDAEVSSLRKKLDVMKASKDATGEGGEIASGETAGQTIEALKEALSHITACSRLEALLLKKKIIKSGDSSEVHAQKVDKLKVLSESLASSTKKSEKRISDNKLQKEEALKFRVTKAREASEIEKELAALISGLEKQRDELEAELKRVNISLAVAQGRLRNAMEERDQFYEANDQIVAHLKAKEDELSRSVSSCKVEADVLRTWNNFLEDTWALRCSYTETKEKEVNDELERHGVYFASLVIELLSMYEKELRPSIGKIEKYVENLKSISEGSRITSDLDENSKVLNPRRNLQEEYLDYEAKIVITFSVVDNMKEQFYAQERKISRKDDPRVKELFDNIEKLREQFESIQRPNLEMETSTEKTDTHFGETPDESKSHSAETSEADKMERHESPSVKTEQVLDSAAELARLESEFGKVNRDYSAEEIGDWEFDELEKELQAGD